MANDQQDDLLSRSYGTPVAIKPNDWIVGRGIRSYGTSQFSDATFRPNGLESPLREEMLAGLTFHATPTIDVYAVGGVEPVHQDFYATYSAGTTGRAGFRP